MKGISYQALAAAALTLLSSAMAFAGPDLGAAEQQATNLEQPYLLPNGLPNKPQILMISILPAAGFLASRTVWPLLVTSCLQHLSSVFPRWYSCPVLTDCCTH